MQFADMKNDFVFRRIFATHPEILCGLLNDLLERSGEDSIDSVEYLPSEQLPQLPGVKFSILDVRCCDRSGVKFIVEMQLVHVPAFDKRVVYNACKAYADQLKIGEPYTKLTDVVAVSICDFTLWPDAEQEKQGLAPIPMLSRWNMRERTSNNDGLLQVQYAFLELPKVPKEKPQEGGAALWAWLFVHAPELTEVPIDLPQGPYRDALAMANQMTFTKLELEAYQKTVNEIEQLRVVLDAKFVAGHQVGVALGHKAGVAEGHKAGVVEGHKAGVAEGHKAGKIEANVSAIFAIFAARGIAVSDDARARIASCNDAALVEQWIGLAVTVASPDELVP